MALAVISRSSPSPLGNQLHLRPCDGSPRPCSRSSSVQISSATSSVTNHSALRPTRTDPGLGFGDIDLSNIDVDETWKTLDNIAALGLTLTNDEDEDNFDESEGSDLESITPPRLSDESEDRDSNNEESPGQPGQGAHAAGPFHKWMGTIRRRAQRSRTLDNGGVEPFPEYSLGAALTTGGHRKSSSGSSYGFVAAVRSATVSLASASVVSRPRRNTARSSQCARTDRGSKTSTSGPRDSEDSASCMERPQTADPAVAERLLQRRRILEELISTEESYIGDIRFLMNVYVTILASLPTPHAGLRASINRNLTDIVELHEEILGELHRIVPHSEYSGAERLPSAHSQHSRKHHRWHSLDSVPEDAGGRPWLQHVRRMVAEPSIAADVAQVFKKRMNRFFIYEEYGAKYEMMIRDVATAHRIMPQWEAYQKGLEALAASLGSVHKHLDHSKKSLTLGDLLVKPVQRICRYPLLFAELLKYTPVCDCPSSHLEIESVLIRLREATAEINRATDDPGMKATIETTWLLQDRLVFPDQCMDTAAKTTIRSFGQVQLCGALHICWQTKESVQGQYMVSILYKNCLCLATASKVDQVYSMRACIGLDSIKVEEADNGRGLQCHTAPFSWKLVFECNHQLYEIIMTACSAKEESEWRGRLSCSDSGELDDMEEPSFYGSVSMDLKSLGTVFGKPGTVARRVSIHRATTVGPKSQLYQVILKNTSATKEPASAASSVSPINRSQSLLTTHSRVPVLAPSRSDRARLEALLADVWSRNILPFPGINSRARTDHLVRNSASTMMRKLSVASFTSSFVKRSASSVTTPKPYEDGPPQLSSIDVTADLDCDHFSFVSEAGTTESKRRLPVIHDEPEWPGNPPLSISSSTAEIRVSMGKTRPFERGRLDPNWFVGNNDDDVGTPALRTTSANNAKPTGPSLGDPETKSPEPAEKSWGPLSVDNALPKRSKSLGKWTKVGALNRGLRTSGIRGFFR